MGRPFVYMNMAMTVDGKITSTRREYANFTSDLDRRTMDRLRAEADAILIGAGTLRADDPPLDVREPEMQRYRRSLGKPDHLQRIVVSAGCELDTSLSFFQTSGEHPPLVATVEHLDPDRLERLAAHAEIIQIGSPSVDLERMMELLEARGIHRLLVEGGGEMNWELVRLGLVNEIYVTVAPVLLGGRDAPTLLEGEGWPMDLRRELRLVEMSREGDEVYCRYEVLTA